MNADLALSQSSAPTFLQGSTKISSKQNKTTTLKLFFSFHPNARRTCTAADKCSSAALFRFF